MAGINPQTGLFDMNYTPQIGGMLNNGMNTGYQGSPVSMQMFQDSPQSTSYISPNAQQYGTNNPMFGETAPIQTDQGGGMFGNFAGKDGWGNTAITGANALANIWLDFENLGVAKDQYSLSKANSNKQWDAYNTEQDYLNKQRLSANS